MPNNCVKEHESIYNEVNGLTFRESGVLQTQNINEEKNMRLARSEARERQREIEA